MSDVLPRPAPGPLERPFWEWCRKGELRIQRCQSCGGWRHPPRVHCPDCSGGRLSWERVSGRAVVWSYTICYPPVLPAFAERVPYNAVVVRLEEGPYLVSNVVECANDALVVGLPVEVVLVSVDEELVLPQFRPVGA